MAEKTNANIGFEKQLWDAACVLWGHIPAAEYRKVIIGLIFLRYISAAFDRRYQELVDEGEGFEEMKGDLSRFRMEDHDLPVPPGTRFGWYSGPLEPLHEAVAAVDPDWVKYFGADSPVYCATLEGEIASFCNAEIWTNCLLSNGKNKVGAPGCVGTVPRFRRKGIGLKMVAMACEELKKQGCDTCFIHYTGVGHWYARLGFQTFLTWYFCKKRLI